LSLESLIHDALRLPAAAVGYHISRELSRQFQKGFVLHCAEDSSFNLQEYQSAGLCSLTYRPELHAERHAAFTGAEDGVLTQDVNVWRTVEWEGHRADVLSVRWTEGFHHKTEHWIVADSRQNAEDLLSRVCTWNREVRGEVLVFNGGCWSKDSKLFESIRGSDFSSLVLAPGLKETIRRDFEQFLQARGAYERVGAPWKRGVLLLGPPGNGKTHTVKALSNCLGIPVLYVKSFTAEYTPPQECVAACFQRARTTRPCLLVLEDLDSLLTEETRSFFLNEMDGFASNTGIITVATTNHPQRLDPAILHRPSRFDRKYHFELPEMTEREAYLQLWAEKVEAPMRLTPEERSLVAQRTAGFSYAYLKELMLSSMMAWVSAQAAGRFAETVAEQVDALRGQMTTET
jgi:hypothetical protein